jgi:hypothetical protein
VADVADIDLDRFVEVVVASPEDWDLLQGPMDRDEFCSAVVTAAAKQGLFVHPGEVADRLTLARRTWLERWI